MAHKVLQKPDQDHIHQLRIALRRFRLSIKLYEFITSTKAGNKLKKSLKKLTNSLGCLRNIDEAILYFRVHTHLSSNHQVYKNLSKLRTVQVKLIKDLLRKFDDKFDTLVIEMTSQLKSVSYTKENNISLLNYASNVSETLSKSIHANLDTSTKKKQRKSRHALRIAIRKWRYYLELFSSVLNRDYDWLLKKLKKYQSLLGQINDVASFDKLCRKMKLTPPDAKLIRSNLVADEKYLLKKFSRLLDKLPL